MRVVYIYYMMLTVGVCYNTSCAFTNNKLVESLEFAGKNRVELQKVLDHYKNDSIKLKAAIYLIENMPQHFSYIIPDMDKLELYKVKSVKEGYLTHQDSIDIMLLSQSFNKIQKIYDSHVITADYLIQNIDFSFYIWTHQPWGKYLTFDDFCDRILPYRIEHEPLELWKIDYYKSFNPILDSLYQGTDVVGACDVLIRYIEKEGFPNNYLMPIELPRYKASYLKEHKVGGCRESTDFITYVMRSLGIPVSVDQLYYSIGLNQAHYWNTVKDTTGNIIPFWLDKGGVFRGLNDDNIRPKRKIYRYSYKMNLESQQAIACRQDLYKIISNSLIRDVTSEYYGKNNILLDLDIDLRDGQLIYLCAFSNEGLVPQGVSLIQNRRVAFKNIGTNLLYFLAIDTKMGLKQVGYPFNFDGTKVNYYNPNINRINNIKLTRKTPLYPNTIEHLDSILGVSIEGDNFYNMSNAKLLYRITDTIRTNYNKAVLINNSKFKYIRCTPEKNKKLEFAELTFYEDCDMEKEIPYSVINASSLPEINNINDNDPLSFYQSDSINKSIIIKFENSFSIKTILFTPRNDDNFIRIGDEYELFYNDGQNWISLGKQWANSNVLFFDAPDNSVLWLRNLSRGKEENVFVYKNNVQKFLL